MPISHNIAAYVKEQFEENQNRDLVYFLCFDDESIFPVNYDYSKHPIYEHWKVLAYACDNELAERIEDKQLAQIFVSASLRCPPVNLTAEEILEVQQEAREWAEAQEVAEGEEAVQPHEFHKMKDYIIVEGFNGEHFKTLALEIDDDKIGEVLEFENELSKQVGWLPMLGHELIRIWIKAQPNYEEVLKSFAEEGRIRLTEQEFMTLFPGQEIPGSEIEETQSEEEQEEVIVVEEESDHDN